MIAVPISAVLPYSGTGAVQTASLQRSPTARRTADVTPQKKEDSVELSGAALAKSLRLQGYSVSMICQKMGLDTKTVEGYLGTTASATTPATYSVPAKSRPQAESTTPARTYVEPKPAYTEPAAIDRARTNLVQGLSQLPLTSYAWNQLRPDNGSEGVLSTTSTTQITT